MENKKSAAQEAAGAKNAQTTSAAAQPTKAATAAKTLEQLIQERTEQVRKQAELADLREMLIAQRDSITSIARKVADEERTGNYVTQVACIVLSLGDGRYNGDDKLKITNPTVVGKFLSQISGDISAKIADIETRLVA